MSLPIYRFLKIYLFNVFFKILKIYFIYKYFFKIKFIYIYFLKNIFAKNNCQFLGIIDFEYASIIVCFCHCF